MAVVGAEGLLFAGAEQAGGHQQRHPPRPAAQARWAGHRCMVPPLIQVGASPHRPAGADVPGSLFEPQCKGWTLRRLRSLLSQTLEAHGVKMPGVNEPYLYVGSWRSMFAWHTEDMDLHSVNYLHCGASKQWCAPACTACWPTSPSARSCCCRSLSASGPRWPWSCPAAFLKRRAPAPPNPLPPRCFPPVVGMWFLPPTARALSASCAACCRTYSAPAQSSCATRSCWCLRSCWPATRSRWSGWCTTRASLWSSSPGPTTAASTTASTSPSRLTLPPAPGCQLAPRQTTASARR
jgi:hypothetical protein